MKSKQQKKEALDVLAAELPKSTITIFTTFSRAGEPGLSVAQLQELKRALRKAEGEYVVAKKTLVDKTLKDLSYDGLDVFGMEGSMGIVLGHGDIYAVSKVLHGFAKQHPSLKLYAAWMDGEALSLEQVTELATMPSREELLARLLGMLQYPLSSLAVVLHQIAEAKPAALAEESAPEPAPETPAEAPTEEASRASEPVATE